MSINSTPTDVFEALSQTSKELLGILLQEPFAINNGFEDLTLEEIGLILEEPFGDGTAIVESYNACKSTYCLLLIELELNGHEILPEPLREKPLKHFGSLFIAPESDFELVKEDDSNLNTVLEISPSQITNSQNEISDPSRDYFHLAELFSNNQLNKEIRISDTTKLRLAIQLAISGCEIATFNKIRDALTSFWPKRIEAIQPFIQAEAFKFTDSTNTTFESHEKQYGAWLYEGKFPRVATLHCLKYLTIIQSVDRLHPSVFELGCFFYFWGALSKDISTPSNPFLEFGQLSPEQLIETAFRLFRLDRIKANANNFNHPISEGQDQVVQEDIYQIMCLLGEWQEEQREQAVA
jgi:hypothetical protein